MTHDSSRALPWREHQPSTRGRRAGLSVDRIVSAAIGIADAEGLAGLSMKNLADRLGSGVMSMYRHVSDKHELHLLMLDAVFGEPPHIEVGDEWRAAARTWAQGMRAVITAHPWVVSLLDLPRGVGPNETAWLEAELRALSGLRLAPSTLLSTALAISSYVIGAAKPGAHEEPGLGFPHLEYPETHDRYPLLTRTLMSGAIERGSGMSEFFEYGLERMLDGIAAALPAEPA